MTSTPAFMDEPQARDEICRVGRSLFERGYVHATAGNISVRLADGYLITPPMPAWARCSPSGWRAWTPRASRWRATGPARPLRCTGRFTSLGIDCPSALRDPHHSTHLVACSLQADTAAVATGADAQLLPPITPYFVMKVGRVPHIPYHRPGDAAAAALVAQTITRYAHRAARCAP